ncbi:DUF6338 family protein [Methylobacterium sp. E-025]|uniref:DUF6338 family protein n=1 Tax=Methylobacterium sp. E-025 TaxID=2836561 RepID=UPI001FBBA220|nr:DUF6338 family protein [Methylobacterium sp. E-025]MCJ2110226.1 DUF6338 family protein [Methylobacterium sp. E-025]
MQQAEHKPLAEDQMPDLKNLDNVYLVLAFVVPGLVISVVRAQFITGRTLKQSENILFFISISAFYYAIALPIIEVLIEADLTGWKRGVSWISVFVCGPTICGLLLGLIAQRGIGRWVAHKLGVNPIHSSPTAWDYKFSSDRGPRFVLVTMDGAKVGGIFGEKSFAASDPTERDIYLEEIWDVSEAGEWSQRPERVGILIPAKQVKLIEFWEAP